MAEIRLTPAQKAAVYTRGGSLLVSAAAGSGKTQVLTKRLMAYITDVGENCDIDQFLIITYTRAAAAELRSRILEELGRLRAANPENRRLRRQMDLCTRAQIGTIHSFCTTLLREHCHLLALAPDFRVLDEDRAAVLRSRAMETLLEARYTHIQEDTAFRALVDTVGSGRDDQRLAEITQTLYTSMQSHPWPERWAEEQKALLCQQAADAGETPWGAYLLRQAKKTAQYWAGQMEALAREIHAGGEALKTMEKAYVGPLEEVAAALRDLCRALEKGWDAARKCFPLAFPRLGALRSSPDEVLSERVKRQKNACKKAMDALGEQFAEPSAALLVQMEAVRPAMEALLDLAVDFAAAYAQEKLALNALDFSDLEHKAVELLCDKETGAPTAAATAVSSRFREIMVDEYQDVNAVQELIFTSVSRNERNLFMVGDVKQSIYRFRLSDPGIFLWKYLRAAEVDAPCAEEPPALRRVLLRENFRSRASVLRAANHVFSNIMSEELGELTYDEAASLRPGAAYPPEGETPVTLEVLSLPEGEEGEERPDKTAFEAAAVAGRIRALVDSGAQVFQDGALRRVRYGDIVILLRSPGTAGAAYRRALAAEGIPVLSDQGGGFFASLEVNMMVSLLAVIDNPHQDVPLIGALRSPLFGFDANALADIRAFDKDADFFTALEKAGEARPKCRAFLDFLREMRLLAPDFTVDALLWQLYDRLDVMALAAAMSDAAARRENLMTLLDYARQFEENGYRGLFQFVAWLRRLEERGEEPRVGGTGAGDTVHIMSIHKSKGLEFPVVFLAGTGRRFNRRDQAQAVLIHPQLGLGPKVVDTRRRLEYPTLARRAIAAKLLNESLSEEMRVLYVAMTRAKERLYITCTVSNADKTLQRLGGSLSAPMDPQVLRSAASMSDWLISAALLGSPDLALRLAPPEGPAAEAAAAPEVQQAPAEPDGDAAACYEEMERRLTFAYPWAGGVDVPSKLTATELKGRFDDAARSEEAASLAPGGDWDFALPDLAGQARPLTGAERGTATHAFMQYVDLAKVGSAAALEGERRRLQAAGRLDGRQAEAVDLAAVERFFASPLGRRILNAGSVRRELRFSLLCPARLWYKNAPEGEQILLQGVVDCCIQEGEDLTVIDYKTDFVTPETAPERTAGYAGQVRAYAYALEQIFGKKVRQGFVAYLRAGLTEEVPLRASGE